MHFRPTLLCAAALALCITAFFPAASSAAIFQVSNTGDAGLGSLRQALLDANAQANTGGMPDLIEFSFVGAGPHIVTPLSPSVPTVRPSRVSISEASAAPAW